MTTGKFGCALALVLLVGGCGLGERLDGWAWSEQEAPLDRVLVGTRDTPGNQSLLYTAMWEAEAAQQSAARARFSAGDQAEMRQAVGEVVYAIDPAQAPGWDAMGTGIIPAWTGKGYGVQRAVGEMAAELRQAAGAEGDAGQAAGQALVCAENTLQWVQQILDLSQRELASDAIAEGSLEEIQSLTRQLNGGEAAASEGIGASEEDCGLQEIARILGPLRPARVAL